jgi:hypothetical protein
MQKFDMDRFNLKKLNLLEGKEQCQVKIPYTFPAWDTIREHIKISAKESLGYYELKQRKPWFNGGSSVLLEQRKQAKLEWLQDLS